jgi:hypothetical protein
VLDQARAVDDLRSVESGIRCLEGSDRGVVGELGRRECLDAIPAGIVLGGESFADPRRAVAKADVAVFAARIAELREAATFRPDQKGAGLTHSGIA